MGKSVASERRVVSYPTNVNAKLLTAESNMHGKSKSAIINDALSQYYEAKTGEEKRRLLQGIR